MKLIDITRTVQNAPVYPGDEPTSVTQIMSLENGDLYNLSRITTDSHAGTHCDAFSHFLKGGLCIDKMDLSHYYGHCCVLSFPYETVITKKILDGKIENTQRLVIHSDGKSFFDKSGAEYIKECGIKTIVTDALSIAPYSNESELHRFFFSAGIAVVENVVLDGVPDGEYTLCAFPVKLGGCDGAPARVVLILDR